LTDYIYYIIAKHNGMAPPINNTFLFLCIITDNTLSSVVPI
jgi:hypothetical protein